MPEAGRLREIVVIQSPTSPANPYGVGGRKPTWADVATVHAEVKPVRAGEMIRAGTPALETTYTVTMRFTAAMTATSRIKWGDRYLYPSSVIDVGSRMREIEAVCTEREPAGAA